MFVIGTIPAAVHGHTRSYSTNEMVCPVEIYLALLAGERFVMIGASLSMIHGNGKKVYIAFVTHVRISSDEMLELMTAPSSVVLLSNVIAHHVMVVNSKYVDKIFWVV